MKLSFAVLGGLYALAAAQCGTISNDKIQALHASYAAAEAEAHVLGRRQSSATYEIPTVFHVITESGTVSGGHVPQDLINRQFDYLNTAFGKHGFSFVLNDTVYTRQPNWRRLDTPLVGATAREMEMKRALRRGDYATLNVYVTSFAQAGLLGWAFFPEAQPTASELTRDGVVIATGSLPGSNFNGGTLIHEVGHWLSLEHTFRGRTQNDPLGGCRGSGDYILDTPAESSSGGGCQIPANVNAGQDRDTCTGSLEVSNPSSIPGPDPIHNYMSYSADSCMSEFTPGQKERMLNAFGDLRAK
ncbi:metalloprotease MEP1-like protein [Cordyceps fumosorosea ARSEF 2679]|uniref:Metalloprotease MEP1-like protein n=1 Tax=Cordyceps fumosorosea (strain ARSEF 2679) TaxID=1081104 RepID=A0A167MRI5_CORFA|nr:metalloprotease MEP1-like protein [Cordyceps fumosorosea ARSEF 2679]OAA54677.1 metalloprotease MEP1-like protein [Cordyceps fumosorosea ARSEF 2679]